MILDLSIDGGRSTFEPGEEIELSVKWNLAHAPDSLQVRLVWHTSGKGDQDMDIAKTVEISQPAAAGSQRLAIILPRGPYSYSGKLISVQWGIELVALPEEESTRREITIGPRGQEVVLPGLD